MFALGATLGSAGALRRSTVDREYENINVVFKRIDIASREPDSVVQHFMQADFIDLLALYNYFYLDFQKSKKFLAVSEIERAVTKLGPRYHSNKHRLIALPVLFAIHLLATQSDLNRTSLSDRISASLYDRSIREIVIQNLITTSSPSPDNAQRPPITMAILNALSHVIDESIRIPHLLHTLVLSIQYLMNVKLLSTLVDPSIIRVLDRLLAKIEHASSDRRFNHLSEIQHLMSLHVQVFPKLKLFDPTSVSPQVTELIFGLESMRKEWTEYAQYCVLLNARMFHTHWELSRRDAELGAGFMTTVQAAESVGKSVQFWKGRHLDSFLRDQGILQNYPISRGKEFSRFLRATIPALLDANKIGIATEQNYLTMKIDEDDFPLSKASHEFLIAESLREKRVLSGLGGFISEWGKAVLVKATSDTVVAPLVTAVVGAAVLLSRRQSHVRADKYDDVELSEDDIKQIIDEITTNVSERLDRVKDGLQEEEEALGSTEIPAPPSS